MSKAVPIHFSQVSVGALDAGKILGVMGEKNPSHDVVVAAARAVAALQNLADLLPGFRKAKLALPTPPSQKSIDPDAEAAKKAKKELLDKCHKIYQSPQSVEFKALVDALLAVSSAPPAREGMVARACLENLPTFKKAIDEVIESSAEMIRRDHREELAAEQRRTNEVQATVASLKSELRITLSAARVLVHEAESKASLAELAMEAVAESFAEAEESGRGKNDVLRAELSAALMREQSHHTSDEFGKWVCSLKDRRDQDQARPHFLRELVTRLDQAERELREGRERWGELFATFLEEEARRVEAETKLERAESLLAIERSSRSSDGARPRTRERRFAKGIDRLRRAALRIIRPRQIQHEGDDENGQAG